MLFQPQGRKHPEDAAATIEDWKDILTKLEIGKGPFARLRLDTIGPRNLVRISSEEEEDDDDNEVEEVLETVKPLEDDMKVFL